jgi:hypothetical protein
MLQPPLTLWLATPQGVDLRRALAASTRLAQEVQHNMAVAAVGLPTLLGVLLAIHAGEALQPGAGRSLACLLSLFWCWRLYRQCRVLGPIWPRQTGSGACLKHLLVAIFVLQGPGLGLLLLLS